MSTLKVDGLEPSTGTDIDVGANVNVGTGASPKAMTVTGNLSADGGLQMGDMLSIKTYTNAEIALLTPSAGDLVFSSTDSVLRCYDGAVWQDCF